MRNPLSGENSRHTASDTLHHRLFIEAKRDKKYLGKILTTLLTKTREKAKKEHKIPVLALKEHDKRGFYLIIHSSDLQAVAKEVVGCDM
jgi:hypothetical protein